MTMSYEEVEQRAGAVADKYAETLRKLLETYTPQQLDADYDYFVNDRPEYVWPEMTAEELITEGRRAKYLKECSILTHLATVDGLLGARACSKTLPTLPTSRSATPLVSCLEVAKQYGATDARANILEVLDALGSVYGDAHVVAGTEAFRLHDTLNPSNREEI